MKRGLTLIEVIIAVAILGVAMVVLLTAASRCIATMKQAKNYQSAQWTLNMGELDFPMLPTEDTDDWEVNGEQYDNGLVFSREVEPYSDEREDGLFIITSRATWSSRGRESYEEVVRYAFLPEMAEDL